MVSLLGNFPPESQRTKQRSGGKAVQRSDTIENGVFHMFCTLGVEYDSLGTWLRPSVPLGQYCQLQLAVILKDFFSIQSYISSPPKDCENVLNLDLLHATHVLYHWSTASLLILEQQLSVKNIWRYHILIQPMDPSRSLLSHQTNSGSQAKVTISHYLHMEYL